MRKTCLVYRTDKIGDFICSIPALCTLRKMLPSHTIVLVTSPYLLSIAQSLRCVDVVEVFSKEKPFPTAKAEYCCALNRIPELSLAKEQCAVRVYAGYWSIPSYVYRMFSPQYRMMPFLDIRRLLKNEVERVNAIIASIDSKAYRRCVQHSSISSLQVQEGDEGGASIFTYPQKYIDHAKEYFSKISEEGRQVILIAPFKSGASKTVPDFYYPTIVQRIHACFPHCYIAILTPPGGEKIARSYIDAIPLESAGILQGTDEIINIVPMIERAQVVIGSSHGPIHIAGLLQKDTIAFYPHNRGHNPRRWGTYGNKTRYIVSEKNVDILPIEHPRRFAERHIEMLLQHLHNILTQ